MSRGSVNALYLLVAVVLALPAAAGPLEDGIAILQQKDYDKAGSLFPPLAKAGNAAAQFNLGAMYDGTVTWTLRMPSGQTRQSGAAQAADILTHSLRVMRNCHSGRPVTHTRT